MVERRWALRSLRARTTALVTLLSAVALVVGATLLLLTLDDSLHRAGDALARGRVDDLALQASHGTLPPVLRNIGGESVAQVFTADGRVLAASPNIVGEPPITAVRRDPGVTMRILRGAPDDGEREDYRVWVSGASGGTVTVLAGSSLESVGEASRTLTRALLLGVPLLVALVALGTWRVVGRTLRPVEDVRAEVAAIRDQDLDRRVPVPGTGDEIARLARTMNEMLDRLAQASRRQRDFVADASHELQSPVSALRAELEVGLGRDDQDWAAAARRMLVVTGEMERRLRDLLFLARTSAGVPTRPTLVDLDDIVLEEAARARPASAVTVDTTRVSAAPVRGDSDELRRMVRNLVENGLRHATSVMTIALTTDAGTARLDVVDDGSGVAPEDRERVFDRFFTGDGSRTQGSGSGLGLAIARSVAVRHHGDLTVVPDDRGAHFRFVMPLDGGPGTT